MPTAPLRKKKSHQRLPTVQAACAAFKPGYTKRAARRVRELEVSPFLGFDTKASLAAEVRRCGRPWIARMVMIKIPGRPKASPPYAWRSKKGSTFKSLSSSHSRLRRKSRRVPISLSSPRAKGLASGQIRQRRPALFRQTHRYPT